MLLRKIRSDMYIKHVLSSGTDPTRTETEENRHVHLNGQGYITEVKKYTTRTERFCSERKFDIVFVFETAYNQKSLTVMATRK